METTLITNRDRYVKGFAIFLVFMLCCTVISRGIYANQMPQVETGWAERTSITHIIEVMGSVTAVKENAIVVPAGMRVEEIYVREGQDVKEGTVLFRLDMDYLTEQIEELENQITLAKQQLKEINSNQSIEAQTRQIEAVRAEEDLNLVTKTQDMLVQQARQRYEVAKAMMDSYPTWEVYAETMQSPVKEQWEDGRKSLETAANEAAMSLQLAENDRNLAVLQAKRNVEDAGRETTKEISSIMEAEQNIQSMQEQLDVFQKFAKQEGAVFSEVTGEVQEILVTIGNLTSDTAALILSDGSGGWIFEAYLSKEQVRYVHQDNPVTLVFQNGKKILADCPVLTARAIDDTNYLITVEVGDTSMFMGETGTLRIAEQEGPYDCCVPISAVHTENDISYIYVIRETNTVLGTELRVVRRNVTVIDRNQEYAALESGSLGEEEQFVVNSDREISPGDTVRPMEVLY